MHALYMVSIPLCSASPWLTLFSIRGLVFSHNSGAT